MIAAKNTVCVVIPVYTTSLTDEEWRSLDRCVDVLGAHPLIAVIPQGLNIEPLRDRYRTLTVERFSDHYFSGIRGYNRMMLSDEFYSRFDAEYEFMLIYQLDAFVFSDQLLHWCQIGYDYIGAPWIPPTMPGRLKRTLINYRRLLYRLMDRYQDTGDHTTDPQFTFSVGNGGFSLRRIAAMRRVLKELDIRAERHRAATIRAWPEDQFFSVEANRYRRRLNIPPAEIGVHFSWETNPMNALSMSDGKLPFGCHAWTKLHVKDWASILSSMNQPYPGHL